MQLYGIPWPSAIVQAHQSWDKGCWPLKVHLKVVSLQSPVLHHRCGQRHSCSLRRQVSSRGSRCSGSVGQRARRLQAMAGGWWRHLLGHLSMPWILVHFRTLNESQGQRSKAKVKGDIPNRAPRIVLPRMVNSVNRVTSYVVHTRHCQEVRAHHLGNITNLESTCSAWPGGVAPSILPLLRSRVVCISRNKLKPERGISGG